LGRADHPALEAVIRAKCPHETGFPVDRWPFELHDDALTLADTSCALPIADLSKALSCGSLLDAPAPLPSVPSESPAALAYGYRQQGGDRYEYLLGMEPDLQLLYPVFSSADPRRSAAAASVNAALQAWVGQRVAAAAKDKAPLSLFCDLNLSQPTIVSVLCRSDYGVGKFALNEATSFTFRLGNGAIPVSVDDLFRTRPSATSAIARRCLADYLHKPTSEFDEILKALPAYKPSDLPGFGLMWDGVMFALPVTTQHFSRLEICFVPYEVLGTSYKALAGVAP
jgi:hypothetical protein